MRCFHWSCGSLQSGLHLQNDERLGAVVFLGEEGRGRRYEKVALDRSNPAKVEAGRVTEAHPRKVTLPARDGKPEKVFFVLEAPRQNAGDVLIRVNTYSAYIRGGSGGWSTAEGAPETLVSGFGAFGLAGRVGEWSDGLVRMRPGDVLKIRPSRSIDGVSSFALWVDEDGTPKTATWREYENLKAVAQVEALVAETKAGQKGLELAFGKMPAVTYIGRGRFEAGIKVGTGVTGPAVILGEEGRGRVKTEVAILGFNPGERLESVAVAKLLEETAPARYSWEQPVVKTIWGLCESEEVEVGAVLVRVSPSGANRTHLEVKPLRGNPTLLASGHFAGGDAGRTDSSPDELWVLRPGDSLSSGTYGHSLSRVIENTGGKLVCSTGDEWEERDGRANPEAYIAKGRAPWGRVPTEWVGRVVIVERWVEDTNRYREPIREVRSGYEGELVSIGNGRLELNLGWDGRDRKVVTVESGLWVRLETEKTVTPADAGRAATKAKAATLRAEAEGLRTAGHFVCLPPETQAKVSRVAKGLESSWSDTQFDFALSSTQDIENWVEKAEAAMAKVRAAVPAAEELCRKQKGGEVLANFDAWKRHGGSTNCGQGWVIRPDGSFREPDSVDCPRPRYDDGTQHWGLVQADELAISWRKACTAAPHEFVVAKRPVGGLTKAQLAAVEEIECGLARQWDGAVGLSGNTVSPPVGRGWGLKPVPAPKKPAAPAGPPVEVGGLNLAGLFGGAASVSDRRRR